jgi:trk system potassium uptake protein TrkA
MRILIVGAGNTGRNLASQLCEMKHDLVVVDKSKEKLESLEQQLDILTIEGSGSSPATLEKAEVEKADLVIAVTDSDEVNILACQYAHAAGVPYKAARVTDTALLRSSRLSLEQLGVDMAISHKEEAAKEIVRLLNHPGVIEIADVLEGRMLVCGLRVRDVSPLNDGTLAELGSHEVFENIRFVALHRNDELSIPTGETRCQAGDELYVAVRPADLPTFLDWAHPGRQPFSKVIVAGGGELGMDVARRLEESILPAVLLDRDSVRAETCATILNKVLVMHGNASDQETLLNAGVGNNTAFVALTGDEELNIISCLLAAKMGAAFTIASVTKPEYAPIIRSLSLLDRVISPHLSVINAILHFVRGRHITAATRLQRVPGELIQAEVQEQHRWVSKQIRDIRIPAGCLIVTILRDDTIHIPVGNLIIEENDKLVMFALPDRINKLRSIFKT